MATSTVTSSTRSTAAFKAAETRRANARKRSLAAVKANRTRRRNARNAQ